MRWLVLILFGLVGVLAACTPMRQAGVDTTRHSGMIGAFSDQVVVSDHPHHVLVGQAMILQQDGATVYVVEIGQLRRGHVRLRMTDAWWNGQALLFHGVRPTERFCNGYRDCGGYRTGVFSFSRTGFETAARRGFDAQLTGPDGALDIHIPAREFARALGQAARM
jgi:uncharacterized membrane protein YeaQ/YmgE (transglycosylase-associated protein family)